MSSNNMNNNNTTCASPTCKHTCRVCGHKRCHCPRCSYLRSTIRIASSTRKHRDPSMSWRKTISRPICCKCLQQPKPIRFIDVIEKERLTYIEFAGFKKENLATKARHSPLSPDEKRPPESTHSNHPHPQETSKVSTTNPNPKGFHPQNSQRPRPRRQRQQQQQQQRPSPHRLPRLPPLYQPPIPPPPQPPHPPPTPSPSPSSQPKQPSKPSSPPATTTPRRAAATTTTTPQPSSSRASQSATPSATSPTNSRI